MTVTDPQVEKLQQDVKKAQGQRDLAEQARREAVDAQKTLGQQINDLQKQLAEVTDSRATNDTLTAENAQLKAQVSKQQADGDKAAKIVEAYKAYVDAETQLKKLL